MLSIAEGIPATINLHDFFLITLLGKGEDLFSFQGWGWGKNNGLILEHILWISVDSPQAMKSAPSWHFLRPIVNTWILPVSMVNKSRVVS